MVRAVHRTNFLARVLPVPVLVDGVRHLRQPGPVLDQFQHICGRKKLDAVRRRIAERLKQPGRDQGRNIVRLAVQQPRSLLGSEPRGQLSDQGKKSLLVFFHTKHQSLPRSRSEQETFTRYGSERGVAAKTKVRYNHFQVYHAKLDSNLLLKKAKPL